MNFSHFFIRRPIFASVLSLLIVLLGAIALLGLTYLFLVQAVKTWFYRRHALL